MAATLNNYLNASVQAYFAPEVASTSDSTHKPTFAAANYVGEVRNCKISPEITERVYTRPMPGRRRRVKRTIVSQELNYTLTIAEHSALFYMALFGTAPITQPTGADAALTNTAFTTGGAAALNGWLHVEVLSETDTLIFRVDQWVSVKPGDTPAFDGGEFVYGLEFMGLYSSSNAGKIADLEPLFITPFTPTTS